MLVYYTNRVLDRLLVATRKVVVYHVNPLSPTLVDDLPDSDPDVIFDKLRSIHGVKTSTLTVDPSDFRGYPLSANTLSANIR